MRRGTLLHAACRSAFARSPGRLAADETGQQRLHPAALAFVVGFPGVVGTLALVAALSRSGIRDGAFPLAAGAIVIACALLILGVRSRLSMRDDRLTVRFFGLRSTTVLFRELKSATFGVAFPSISYAIALTDRGGRKALIHANWWRNESAVVTAVCRALVEYDVPMDRPTARVVSQVLRVKRPRQPSVITH